MLSFVLLLAAVPLRAQAPPPGPPATIDVTFHVMQIGRAAVPAFRYATGPGEGASIDLRSHRRTGPYRYRGPNPVVFFRETAGPEGASVREPVGTLSFTGSLRQALVFAIPRGAGAATADGAGIEFVAIDDSRGAFGPDTLVIYNALPMRVGGLLGGRRVVIDPGAGPPIPVGDWRGKSIPLEFWVETAGGPRLVLGGEIGFTPDNREVMVLLPPRRAGSWLIQSVRVVESMDTPKSPTPLPVR